jgi:hypothetical protein
LVVAERAGLFLASAAVSFDAMAAALYQIVSAHLLTLRVPTPVTRGAGTAERTC